MVENKDDLAKRFNFDDWESFMELDVDELVEPSASILKRPVNSQRTLTLNDDQKGLLANIKNNIIHVPGRKAGEYMGRGISPKLENSFPGITDFAITYRLFVDENSKPEYTVQDIVELIDEEFGYRTSTTWVYAHTSRFLNREE